MVYQPDFIPRSRIKTPGPSTGPEAGKAPVVPPVERSAPPEGPPRTRGRKAPGGRPEAPRDESGPPEE